MRTTLYNYNEEGDLEMKKLGSLLLAAVLVFSLCCLPAFAEDSADTQTAVPVDDAVTTVAPLIDEVAPDSAGVEGTIIPGATPDPVALSEAVLAEMRVNAAERLKAADFFRGTDIGMELDRAPNRAEAAAALVRMLGAEAIAADENSDHPFADVKASSAWANPIVGYLFKNGLTKGVTETDFGARSLATAKQFYTFALRSLGYKDDVDFTYDTAIEKAVELKVISAELGETLKESDEFTRGDMAIAMFYALTAKKNDSDLLLVDALVEAGGVKAEQADALKAPLPDTDADADADADADTDTDADAGTDAAE